MFENFFGDSHLSWKCLRRSVITSFASVILIYLILGPLLNLMDTRAGGALPFWQILVFGAVVNLIPDYLSMWETRVVLKIFERVSSTTLQLVVLLVDFLLSACIILGSLAAFLWVTGAQTIWVEHVAILSPYSVFFFSTFVTSVWALVYFLSTLLMRLFAGTFISGNLDIKAHTGGVVGVVGFFIVFASSLAAPPVITNLAGTVDEVVCYISPDESCWKTMRSDFDVGEFEDRVLRHCGLANEDRFREVNNCVSERVGSIVTTALSDICGEDDPKACFYLSFLRVDESRQLSLFEQACDGGLLASCNFLGVQLIDTEPEKAADLFQRVCNGSEKWGCSNLGYMYQFGFGVDQDNETARQHYEKSCSNDLGGGCSRLAGLIKDNFFDVLTDFCDGDAKCDLSEQRILDDENLGTLYQESFNFFEKGCLNSEADACGGLGDWHSFFLRPVEAAKLFETACNDGHFSSCNNIGRMYIEGHGGLEKDIETGTILLARACGGGDARGCYNLGAHYHLEEERPDLAVKWYEDACTKGEVWGCRNLGYLLAEGEGVDVDTERALALFQDGCERDDGQSCRLLVSYSVDENNLAIDQAARHQLLEKSCNLKDWAGCSGLALLILENDDSGEANTQALELFETACTGEDPVGCVNLGNFLLDLNENENNDERAVAAFEAACEMEDPKGCDELGRMYGDGLGVEKDLTKAESFFRRACDQNFFASCYTLGHMYRNGDGVERNFATALIYFENACDGTAVTACITAGNMHLNGEGTEATNTVAESFFMKACEQDVAVGCHNAGVI